MKDLFVYTADADAQQFLKSILNRPQALFIKPIEFHVERTPAATQEWYILAPNWHACKKKSFGMPC
ncbi:MAG: hypothetical protein WCJ40_13170 [Planctomycetota bacterium]